MRDGHAQGDVRQEVLALMRGVHSGALATLLADAGGPYVSLVNVAPQGNGEPILLLSQLAWHTRNLAVDSRASLLLSPPPQMGDPLAGARVSLIGILAKNDQADVRAAYLSRHPLAERYAGFNDFSFYCFSVSLAHYVAGFGRIETFTRNQLGFDRGVIP
jgi:putative heme iron utilization protein